jgi:hypothetical protein
MRDSAVAGFENLFRPIDYKRGQAQHHGEDRSERQAQRYAN